MDSHALPKDVDAKPRVLVFAGEIETESVENFMREFAELRAEPGPIQVQLFSIGGDPYGAMAIYDLIRSSPNEVHTIAYGDVSSAAVLVFQAGKQRVIAPNCTLLLHPTSTHIEGATAKVLRSAKEAERIHRHYCQLLADRSGMSLKKVRGLCSKDSYLSARQALDLGLADYLLLTR